MAFSYERLKDFIQEVSLKNLDGSISNLMGVSVAKCFFRSKSNIKITNYKIVKFNQFAWRAIDVGRDGMSIALSFFEESILVSPAYIVFEVKDIQKLNPYYLFLFLRKQEFERYAKYHAWGSIRETFNWDSLCDFLIPLVSIEKQNKFIKELARLDEQIQIRKKSSEKLRKLIVSYKRFFYDSKKEVTLSDSVNLITRKNKDNKVKNAVGISWRKTICEYGAIIREEDYSKLQIIEKDDFIWNKDLKNMCCLSCWTNEKPGLVSSSYQVFNIVDKDNLNVSYLMACFLDPEFDRYARYHAFGSVRDLFKPPQLLKFKISLIDIEKQTLFSYLYELFLINEKIVELCEKRREIVLENFEYLLED